MFELSDERKIRHPKFHVGITIDGIDRYREFGRMLSLLPIRPRLRIVFDYGESAASYLLAVRYLSEFADILGEPVDSEPGSFRKYSVKHYKTRFEEYLQTLGQYVAIWEIANEINGEWLGSNPAQVHEKALVGLEVIRKAKKLTMATYYLNPDCYSRPQNEMFTWMKNYPIPADEVTLSYYDDDCSGPLSQVTWEKTIEKVASLVKPGTPIGIGECGTTNRAEKIEFLTRYGRLIHAITHRQWMGGGYWWHGRQDFLPSVGNAKLETFIREWMSEPGAVR